MNRFNRILFSILAISVLGTNLAQASFMESFDNAVNSAVNNTVSAVKNSYSVAKKLVSEMPFEVDTDNMKKAKEGIQAIGGMTGRVLGGLVLGGIALYTLKYAEPLKTVGNGFLALKGLGLTALPFVCVLGAIALPASSFLKPLSKEQENKDQKPENKKPQQQGVKRNGQNDQKKNGVVQPSTDQQGQPNPINR